MTPAERTMRARIAAFSSHLGQDGSTRTQAARRSFADSFRTGHSCRVCPSWTMPDGLSEAEITRRATIARRLHYQRIAYRSAKVRSR
ncbi:MAG TPA: hypothetical protein VM305_01210 [Candidatus Limnocylindrales bacterium]|nr:hypothetical protein [Candidatus Limnocylindrales bacterium]